MILNETPPDEKACRVMVLVGDSHCMTVVADSKHRVTLRFAKPGDRFDVRQSGDGKLVLTPLVPDDRPNQVRLVRRHGYTVGVSKRPISQETVRKLLDEFP